MKTKDTPAEFKIEKYRQPENRRLFGYTVTRSGTLAKALIRGYRNRRFTVCLNWATSQPMQNPKTGNIWFPRRQAIDAAKALLSLA